MSEKNKDKTLNFHKTKLCQFFIFDKLSNEKKET